MAFLFDGCLFEATAAPLPEAAASAAATAAAAVVAAAAPLPEAAAAAAAAAVRLHFETAGSFKLAQYNRVFMDNTAARALKDSGNAKFKALDFEGAISDWTAAIRASDDTPLVVTCNSNIAVACAKKKRLAKCLRVRVCRHSRRFEPLQVPVLERCCVTKTGSG
jgi:hypothetical protein